MNIPTPTEYCKKKQMKKEEEIEETFSIYPMVISMHICLCSVNDECSLLLLKSAIVLNSENLIFDRMYIITIDKNNKAKLR